MGIGGPDSMVVRNPIDNKPYIPGSSLKGKLRAMLDIEDGSIESVNMGQVKNGTSQDPKNASPRLFGSARRDEKQRPSRVIIRDAMLTSSDDDFKNTDLPYTESKTEVVIDRITAKAMPRQIERVPAGAEFELNMVLNVFTEDNENDQMKNLMRAIKLLQDDYLGGSGSRGYGQIEVVIENVAERTINYYLGETEETNITEKFLKFK
jgi:CRISPR-associated protein Csm3